MGDRYPLAQRLHQAFKEEFGYLPSQITKEPETGSQNEENTKHIDHEEA